MKTKEQFDSALSDLLAEYADLPPGDLLDGLDLQMQGLKDQVAQDELDEESGDD